MGNVEEKIIPKTETFIHVQAKDMVRIPREKENQPKTMVVKTIAKPPFKALFHKIQPIIHSGTIDVFEIQEPANQKVEPTQVRREQRTSLLENIIFSSQKIHGRVQVNWNSFFKIKKKSYLEEYVFCKEIGKGSFGTVVKAKSKFSTNCRAIKIIKQSPCFQKESNKIKLYSEIAIPIQLDHPNIAKVYEVFEWKKSLAIVMELCEGGDLFTFIKNQRKFTESIAAGIFRQIMSGVYYLHKKGVCHRDLKPENMLYDNQSKLLKLIDFGTAIKVNKNKQLSSLMGTPYYIAPEVIKGQYNELCDIWSCGVILYIILSGSPPFQGKNQKEIFDRALHAPVSFNNPIWAKRTPQVRQLIESMLSKDPKKRPSAEQVLSSPWFNRTMKGSGEPAEIGDQIINNLKNFHFQNKLKAVVYTFIASQLYENKDKQALLAAFREIDKDGDGVIEKDELIEIFNSEDTSLPPTEIEKILKIIDTNGSGRIDFTEFLVAASNEEQLLKKKQLENAFAYLDTDHSGYITIEEVKAFLDGSEETCEEIRQIFGEVDVNGDGKISKNEFISLLIGKK